MMTYRFSRTRYLVCHIITIMSNLTITFVLTELKTTPENCPDFPDWSSGAARSITKSVTDHLIMTENFASMSMIFCPLPVLGHPLLQTSFIESEVCFAFVFVNVESFLNTEVYIQKPSSIVLCSYHLILCHCSFSLVSAGKFIKNDSFNRETTIFLFTRQTVK